jgi:hypothetical protein
MICYHRRTRTTDEAREFLSTRYDEQADKYPLMRTAVRKAVYIAVNLKSARQYYVKA